MEAYYLRLFSHAQLLPFLIDGASGLQLQHGSWNAKAPFPRLRAEKMNCQRGIRFPVCRDVSSHVEAAGSCQQQGAVVLSWATLGTAAKCPSGALGPDPDQEHLGATAICQSHQVTSSPGAGTGCFLALPLRLTGPGTGCRRTLHTPLLDAAVRLGAEVPQETGSGRASHGLECEDEPDVPPAHKGIRLRVWTGLSADPQTSWLFPLRNKTLVFGGVDRTSPSDHVGQSEIPKNKEVPHLPRDRRETKSRTPFVGMHFLEPSGFLQISCLNGLVGEPAVSQQGPRVTQSGRVPGS